MIVAELLALLKEQPQDAEVTAGHYSMTAVELIEFETAEQVHYVNLVLDN